MREDLLLERLELGGGLEAELRHERLAGIGVRLEGLGLAAGAVQREHQLRPEPLAERMARTSAVSSPTSSAWRPQARSASIRVSSAERRSSSSSRTAAVANGSFARSESAGPRQSSSAARSVRAASSGARGLELALARFAERAGSARGRAAQARSSSAYPGGRVTSKACGSSAFRRRDTCCCRAVCASAGGVIAPQLVDEPVARDRLSAVRGRASRGRFAASPRRVRGRARRRAPRVGRERGSRARRQAANVPR